MINFIFTFVLQYIIYLYIKKAITCFFNYYSNTTKHVTKANRIINPRINLQMYFNHVVYGTSMYANPKIKIKLVGPTMLNIP